MVFCSFQSSLEGCLWIHREIWLLSTEENRHMGGFKQGMQREIESGLFFNPFNYKAINSHLKKATSRNSGM